jgi:hypothetical protein
MKNPIPAIRAEFLERVGLPGLNKQPDKASFSAELDYYAAQHPDALRMQLALHLAWRPGRRQVHIMIFQPSALFEPWDEGPMDAFFDRLSEALRPGMEEYVPPWGNFLACVRPFGVGKGGRSHSLAYISYIECGEYQLDEIIELALASYEAGKDAVVSCKTIAEAIGRRERNPDIRAHVAGMKRLIAEEEKKFELNRSSVLSH